VTSVPPVSAAPRPSPASWLRIGTVGTQVPTNTAEIGPTPGGRPLQLEFVLEPRDSTALANFASDVSTSGNPLFRHFLGKGRLMRAFGPAPATIQAVKAVLKAQGFVPLAVSADGLSIQVSTTVGQAEAGLRTRIASYRLASGRTASANTNPPSLPASIAPDVQAVIGLDTVPEAQPGTESSEASKAGGGQAQVVSADTADSPCNTAQYAASSTGSYTADELAQAYDFDGLYNEGDLGSGATVALYELEPYSPTDISIYQTCYGTDSDVTNIAVDHGAGSGTGSGEAALDIEDVIGLAPDAHIEVYEAPNTPEGAIDDWRRIAMDDTAQVVSTSWLTCEALSAKAPTVENTIFAEMVAQGQTVLSASGDSGSEGCLPNKGSITASVGKDPSAIAVSPGTGTVYVADTGSADVSVESESRGPVSTIHVGKDPDGMAIDPDSHEVYVTDATKPGTVSTFDGATCGGLAQSHCAVSTISGLGNDPGGIAIDASDGTAYVADAGSDTVSVISEATASVVGTVPLGEGATPYGVAVDPTTHQVYVTDFGTGAVSVVDGTTCNATTQTGCSTLPETIPVGAGPEGLAVDSATDTVYVADSTAVDVSVIDESTNSVMGTITLNGGSNEVDVAVLPDDDQVLITQPSALAVVSTTTNDLQDALETAGSPVAIAVDPTTGNIFTANNDNPHRPGSLGIIPTFLDVDDPSDQPDVTGVGGTDLTAPSGPVETTWNVPVHLGGGDDSGASGGGISSLFSMPSYQEAVIGSESSGEPCGNASGDCREVPDVSASADEANGYIIFYNGKWTEFGGTSAASPLWAALVALTVVRNGPGEIQRLGNINPDLYQLAAEGHPDFNDVTTGDNDLSATNAGLYGAASGYDMATGLGSPVGAALAADLDPPFSAPEVTTQPTSQVANSGSDVTFSAAASGTPAPTVQWWVSKDGGSTFAKVGGATLDSYTFKVKPKQDGDEYEAVFTNALASVTSDVVTVTVSKHSR
jgi:YVTN family beta-propeller protein